MLTLERFKWLVDSYGARLERWPEETRDQAGVLLNTSQAAREILLHAQVLDEAIAAAVAKEDSQVWPTGEAGAALARLRSQVAARIGGQDTAASVRRIRRRPLSSMSALLNPLHHGWGGLLAGGVIAIAAGFVLGFLHTSSPPAGDVLLLLEPTPLPIPSDSLQ